MSPATSGFPFLPLHSRATGGDTAGRLLLNTCLPSATLSSPTRRMDSIAASGPLGSFGRVAQRSCPLVAAVDERSPRPLSTAGAPSTHRYTTRAKARRLTKAFQRHWGKLIQISSCALSGRDYNCALKMVPVTRTHICDQQTFH